MRPAYRARLPERHLVRHAAHRPRHRCPRVRGHRSRLPLAKERDDRRRRQANHAQNRDRRRSAVARADHVVLVKHLLLHRRGNRSEAKASKGEGEGFTTADSRLIALATRFRLGPAIASMLAGLLATFATGMSRRRLLREAAGGTCREVGFGAGSWRPTRAGARARPPAWPQRSALQAEAAALARPSSSARQRECTSNASCWRDRPDNTSARPWAPRPSVRPGKRSHCLRPPPQPATAKAGADAIPTKAPRHAARENLAANPIPHIPEPQR